MFERRAFQALAEIEKGLREVRQIVQAVIAHVCESVPEPRLLTVPQAAACLAVTDRTVAALVARKELPSVKLGRRRLIKVADLDAFVEGLPAE